MALDAMNISVTEVDVDMDKGEHKSKEMIAVSLLLNRNYDLINCNSL